MATVSNVLSTTNAAFRRSLLQAAREARKAGDIDARQHFLIFAASCNPRTLDRIRATVQEAAVEEGLVQANTQVDWDAIIDFITKLIPLIVQIIELFA